MGEFACFPMAPGPYAPAANVIGGWIVTSWFGGRIDPLTGRPGNHGGDDLAHAHCNGAPFYAVKAGRVSQGWDPGGGGNWTSLFCADGDYIGYGHALRFAPGVHGTKVEAGTILGWIDSTGGSTGAHMHFALNLGGSGPYDDPTDFLRRAADAGRFPGSPPHEAASETADEVVEILEEIAMARHVVNIDGNQIYVSPELKLFSLTDQGRATLLELGVVEKLPNGDEWSEVTDPVLNTLRPKIAAGEPVRFGAL